MLMCVYRSPKFVYGYFYRFVLVFNTDIQLNNSSEPRKIICAPEGI